MIDLQDLFSCAILKRSQRIFSISFLLKYLEFVRLSRGHLRAPRLFLLLRTNSLDTIGICYLLEAKFEGILN